MKARVLLAATAFAMSLSGCATHMWVDEGGRRVDQPLSENSSPTDPAEPTFCLAAIKAFWGGTAPVQKFGGTEGVVEQIRSASSYRNLHAPVLDPSDDTPCDLLVDVGISGGDAAGTRCCDLVVYRPGASASLWRAEACGQVPLPYLSRLMHTTFRPGNPYFERYAAGKKPRAAPSAVPVAAEVVAPAIVPRVQGGIEELPAQAAARPHSYAIVVGVEHYREKLPNADFAVGDAKLASQYFQRVLGVPEENIALLTDDRATKGDFEKYFERWLPNRVEAGDTVYVYYSGHGAPNPSKGDSYLVPFDGDPTYIDQTGFAVKRMLDDLAKLPAKQVYVAMDSCFSGAGGRSVIAKGARPLVTVTQSEVPSKVTVLSASAGDQISNSYEAKGHGLFTYYLLKGLKEKGGDLRAAFDYSKPEVARTARREFNADQDPQWRQGR